MNFIELLENYGIYFILEIIVAIVIICIINSKQKHKSNANDAYSTHFWEQAYQNSILDSLPYEDRLDYTNLYKKLIESEIQLI